MTSPEFYAAAYIRVQDNTYKRHSTVFSDVHETPREARLDVWQQLTTGNYGGEEALMGDTIVIALTRLPMFITEINWKPNPRG